MARLIPSDFESVPGVDDFHAAEVRTLVRLREGLDDSFAIYHGVRWAVAGRKGSVYGEIDFIIANRYGQLLAIEQKDAQILADATDLVARYRRGPQGRDDPRLNEDKSVTTQVNRNLNALRAQFGKRYPGRKLEVDYLLYLPSARLKALPSSVDPSRVVDATRDSELLGAIESLLEGVPSRWSDERLDDLPLIEQFLSRHVDAAPHIGVLGRSAREFTTRLSGGLSTWADRLTMNPWRLHVQGTAGSGKTQLALQELRKAREAGKTALYVCFNRPLADAMKRIAPDPGAIVTFHELARQLRLQAGRPDVDFSQRGAFEEIASSFIELSPGAAGLFDTLVIDEGQDIDPAWVPGLLGMAREDSRVLWLEDPEQQLYGRGSVALDGWVRLASPVNYRSPRLLVEFINWLGLTDEPVEAGSALLGFDPDWRTYDEDVQDSLRSETDAAVSDLIAQGYAAQNIAVLSFRGLERSRLAGAHGPAVLAGRTVRRQRGYNALGETVWSDGELLVDSLFRFKGQAADAVVITEVDFEAFGAGEQRRLFVALTRARLQVALVTSSRADELLRERLEGGR